MFFLFSFLSLPLHNDIEIAGYNYLNHNPYPFKVSVGQKQISLKQQEFVLSYSKKRLAVTVFQLIYLSPDAFQTVLLPIYYPYIAKLRMHYTVLNKTRKSLKNVPAKLISSVFFKTNSIVAERLIILCCTVYHFKEFRTSIHFLPVFFFVKHRTKKPNMKRLLGCR